MRYYFIVLLFICSAATAQKHDYIWHLGYEDSLNPAFVLDFNFPNDSMYIIPRQIEIGQDNSSFCDKDGKMFCYTNGVVIHDSTHQLMLNGDSLNPGQYSSGNRPYTGYPITEGTMFLPIPSRDTIIKLFHLGVINSGSPHGFFCDKFYVTTINTKGNNGQGEVISKNKLLIQDTIAFALEAVKHANGRDWWIVVPKVVSNGYFRFLLTRDSIFGPYYQSIGQPYNFATNEQASFSPNGTKYARYSTLNGLDIFDFDRCTGLLSNHIHGTPPVQYVINQHVTYIPSSGGICFSPNSRYVYLSTPTRIYQCDVTANNVLATLDTVAVYDGFYLNSPISVSAFSMMLLAPNGKIYITTTTGIPFMHIIHAPDLSGQTCNVEQRGLQLLSQSPQFLPNFPHYRMGALPDACDSTIAVEYVEEQVGLFKVYPNPTDNLLVFEWELNNKNSHRQIILYNTLGQPVQEIMLSGNVGQEQISVEDLPIGIYFCKLYANGETISSQKIVIVR